MKEYTWDIFIAHAGPDADVAELLYDLLAHSCTVFLDNRSLRLGDDWDQELRLAQDSSLMTVVLVSTNTNRAFYQREEIARAIEMARDETQSHRVIPLYLGDMIADVPYGLRVKHGMVVEDSAALETAAQRLLELLQSLDSSTSAIASGASTGAIAAIPSPDVIEEIEQEQRERYQAELEKAKEFITKTRELLDRIKHTGSGNPEDTV